MDEYDEYVFSDMLHEYIKCFCSGSGFCSCATQPEGVGVRSLTNASNLSNVSNPSNPCMWEELSSELFYKTVEAEIEAWAWDNLELTTQHEAVNGRHPRRAY